MILRLFNFILLGLGMWRFQILILDSNDFQEKNVIKYQWKKSIIIPILGLVADVVNGVSCGCEVKSDEMFNAIISYLLGLVLFDLKQFQGNMIKCKFLMLSIIVTFQFTFSSYKIINNYISLLFWLFFY